MADHAKAVMQAAAAGTGVRLSDGSSNVLPGRRRRRRARRPGPTTSGWSAGRWSAATTRAGTSTPRSCRPASGRRSPSTATDFAAAGERLRNYVERQSSGILDEPATARALADFLLRGLDCGAISADEVATSTGLDADRLAGLAHRATGEGA